MHLRNRFNIVLLMGLLSSSVAFAQNSTTTTPVASTSAPTTSGSASAQVNPQVFVQGVVNNIVTVLNNNQIPASGGNSASTNVAAALPQIEQSLSGVLDLQTMSTFIVPPTIWNAASLSAQLDFQNALLDFISILYSGATANYNPGQYQVVVNPYRGGYTGLQRLQINVVIVNNTNPSGNVSIFIVLESVGNSWKILDLSFNGSISVVSNVQSQIQSIIQNMQTNNSAPPALSALTTIIKQHNQSQQNNGS